MSRIHLVNLLSYRDVKEGFDRKPTTIVLKRNKASQSEQFCLDASQGDPSSFHLVNLLSIKDVKESLS